MHLQRADKNPRVSVDGSVAVAASGFALGVRRVAGCGINPDSLVPSVGNVDVEGHERHRPIYEQIEHQAPVFDRAIKVDLRLHRRQRILVRI